jgi:hypothetical protein
MRAALPSVGYAYRPYSYFMICTEIAAHWKNNTADSYTAIQDVAPDEGCRDCVLRLRLDEQISDEFKKPCYLT